MNVISACCDKDITALTGELRPGKTGKWSFVYRKGAMPVHDIVLITQSLIQHGIFGKAKVRKLQKHEGSQLHLNSMLSSTSARRVRISA